MQFIKKVKRTSLPLRDQASITIDTSVEKKCVLILLNSNHLNSWIRIIEHLLRLIKLVFTEENGFHILYLSKSYSTQQHKERHTGKSNNEHHSRRSNKRRGKYE